MFFRVRQSIASESGERSLVIRNIVTIAGVRRGKRLRERLDLERIDKLGIQTTYDREFRESADRLRRQIGPNRTVSSEFGYCGSKRQGGLCIESDRGS